MPLLGWLQRLRQQRVLQRRPIPDALWELVLLRHAFLRMRSADDLAELRRLATLFLDAKRFDTAGTLALTDEIAVTIAAQACLPILRLGLHWYDGFIGIVVHPDEVVAPRERMDEDGIVHQYDEVLVGEAMPGGPVMLSWHDVRLGGELSLGDDGEAAYNVVIHEFVHVLDMRKGAATGLPPIEDRTQRRRFAEVMERSFQAFCDRLDAGEEDVIDEYGDQGLEEFFPVASEAFFVTPHALLDIDRELYGVLAEFYRQDPAAQA